LLPFAHGIGFIAVLCALLWSAVALVAHDTALGVAALAAAASSLALTLWLCRERQRLTQALAATQADNAQQHACVALFEASLEADMAQVLARSAALLGARRAWLRVEAVAGVQDLDWSLERGVHPADPTSENHPWWQPALSSPAAWADDSTAPARCAVALRQNDVSLGVLAFEDGQAARTFAAPAARLLPALASLTTQLLLRMRLEQALAEASEHSARERRLLLSQLSHKLRTPMTAVLGFAQILELDDSLALQHREFVREIESAGQTLLNMLNEQVGAARD
jgi:K+-sensing histidine kinase KdpD